MKKDIGKDKCVSQNYYRIFMASVLVAQTRQTICECIYFRSCERDGAHTIRSALSENPMMHAHFMAISSIKKRIYCQLKFYTAGEGNFTFFADSVSKKEISQVIS